MGYDVANDEVGIVGYVNGAERLPTVFELNATGDGFTTQTLAALPGATQNATVSAISSDAHRIAGTTLDSPNTLDLEGTTWLRSNPINPIGIGSLSNATNRSQAIGAWSNGVVGSSGGQNRPVIWDEVNGIQELLGTGISLALAEDVSSNGQIAIGSSLHEVFNGAAYFWDSSGINRLNDNIEGHSTVSSSAKNISPNGNYIGGEISAIDPQGNFKLYAVIWEGPERTLRVLTDSNDNFIQGGVSDISDLGYAVGTFFDASFNAFGFIWNPDFTNGVEIFEDWLTERQADFSPQISTINVTAISEDRVNGKLRFISNDNDSSCLLYTSPSPRDRQKSRMPSSA